MGSNEIRLDTMDGMCITCGGNENSLQNFDLNYVRKRPFCRTNIRCKYNIKTDFKVRNFRLWIEFVSFRTMLLMSEKINPMKQNSS